MPARRSPRSRPQTLRRVDAGGVLPDVLAVPPSTPAAAPPAPALDDMPSPPPALDDFPSPPPPAEWVAPSQPPAVDLGRPAPRAASAKALLRDIPRREQVAVEGGAQLRMMVLACTDEDTTAVDLSSGAVIRLRVPWPEGHLPDLATFDVVEATLAPDPERDDLAQPEAATGADLPRQVGTLQGRKVRRMLARLAAPADGPLLGFLGPSAPYWEFRGARPSVALVAPVRGPQLIRRRLDDSTWVRFGWAREDVWLPMEDRGAARALEAARRDRLAGKDLVTALGFRPQYLLVSVTRPRQGHCYKVCTAVLPRG